MHRQGRLQCCRGSAFAHSVVKGDDWWALSKRWQPGVLKMVARGNTAVHLKVPWTPLPVQRRHWAAAAPHFLAAGQDGWHHQHCVTLPQVDAVPLRRLPLVRLQLVGGWAVPLGPLPGLPQRLMPRQRSAHCCPSGGPALQLPPPPQGSA